MRLFTLLGLAVFALTQYAWAAPEIMKGQVLLNKKVLQVTVQITKAGYSSKDRMVIGDEVFSIVQSSGTQMMGMHKVIENGRVVVDKSAEISLESSDILAAAKGDPEMFAMNFNFGNAREFTCPQKANALLLLGDNLTNDAIIGNCLILK